MKACRLESMQACTHTDIQADIQTYRHTVIQAYTFLQTYRHTDIHDIQIQTYRHAHTDIQAYRHADMQTYRHEGMQA